MRFSEATALLADAQRIAVIGHIRPDADAIGSICATVAALKTLGKQAFGLIGEPASFSENLLSIPGAAEITHPTELPEVDMVITVDCATVDRTGTCALDIARHPKVLVIDHHASNPGFGTVNIIDTSAESTTVMLVEWFDALGIELTQDIAHALYAGLATDTGSFRWGRPAMHELAARLMRCGVNIRQVGIDLLDVHRVADIMLLGKVLPQFRLITTQRQTLGVLVADFATIRDYPVNSVEGLVEFVRALEGVDIGVVFKEYQPGQWAVSLRAVATNVAEVALSFGGGGHRLAAGYSAVGSIDEVVAALIARVEMS